jgi:hypothetical protein
MPRFGGAFFGYLGQRNFVPRITAVAETTSVQTLSHRPLTAELSYTLAAELP